MRSITLNRLERLPAGPNRSDHLRKLMRSLVAATDEFGAVKALDDLLHAATLESGHDSVETRSFRIGLVRFPYRPWRGGQASPRIVPVLLKPSRARDRNQSSNSMLVPHPARQSIQALRDLIPSIEQGDLSALHELLDATPRLSPLGLRMMAHEVGKRGLKEAALTALTYGDESGDGECSYELAQALSEANQPSEALEAAGRADQRGSAGGAFFHGELLAEAGESTQAEHAYRRADARGDGRAAVRLAELLIRTGDISGAETAMRRADDRGSAYAATMLGIRLHQQGNDSAAMEALERGDDRGDQLAPLVLGDICRESGNEAAAEAAWRRADERGHAAAAARLAELALKRGNHELAEAAFRRALDRGDSLASLPLSNLLFEQGRALEAIDLLREVVDEDDLNTDDENYLNRSATVILGALLAHQGDEAGAEDEWRKAAELGSKEAAYQVAEICLKRGDVLEAVPFLGEAVSSEREEIAARAWLLLGQVFVEIGQRQGAISSFSRVIAAGLDDLTPMAQTLLDAVVASSEDPFSS